VAKAEHRVEECLQRAKGKAGLADYEVRTWRGWHHHQTLGLLATWFLTQETRRGKKMDTSVAGIADAKLIAGVLQRRLGSERRRRSSARRHGACDGVRSSVLHWKDLNLLLRGRCVK